ncbi:MAG: hypothetical protein ACPGVN_07730 [Alphaproteobacteria bacterium]
MNRLLTNQTISITELREPSKVLAEANGKPVAILKNNDCVGYLVPNESIEALSTSYMPDDVFNALFEETLAESQPVLDYLKDK